MRNATPAATNPPDRSGGGGEDADKQAEPASDFDAKAKQLDQAWRRAAFDYSTYGLAGLGALGVIYGLYRPHGHWSDDRFALFGGSAVSALILVSVAIFVVGRDGGGLVGLIIGQDRRVSTSKTQVGLWTIAVVFAFSFFSFLNFRTGLAQGFTDLQANYLLLLGGPFAAAVLAKATTSTKIGDGSTQKTPAAAPTVADVGKSDDGSVSLSDTQFLLFNLVALTYFIVAFVKDPSRLPEIPDTLVGLTSASAFAYLGSKVVSSTKPLISSVSIITTGSTGRLATGTEIRILGQNFTPTPEQTETRARLAVLFGAVEVPVLSGMATDSEIKVVVPDLGALDAPIDISVMTTSGAVTDPYRLLTYKNP